MAAWVGYKTSVTNLVRPWLTLSESEVAQSCPTLCDPMGCSLPGSSVHEIFQAIVLEWIAISFSRGSSQPRDRTRVSRIVDRRFTVWATCFSEVIFKSSFMLNCLPSSFWYVLVLFDNWNKCLRFPPFYVQSLKVYSADRKTLCSLLPHVNKREENMVLLHRIT